MRGLFDNNSQTIKNLMSLARAGEELPPGEQQHACNDKWAEKAVKNLLKKLRRGKGEGLEELERAIVGQDPTSACVL